MQEMCNWIGNEAWTKELDWSGKNAFNEASKFTRFILLSTIRRIGEYAGNISNYDKFTFMQLFNAAKFTC